MMRYSTPNKWYCFSVSCFLPPSLTLPESLLKGGNGVAATLASGGLGSRGLQPNTWACRVKLLYCVAKSNRIRLSEFSTAWGHFSFGYFLVCAIIFLLGDEVYSWELPLQELTADTGHFVKNVATSFWIEEAGKNTKLIVSCNDFPQWLFTNFPNLLVRDNSHTTNWEPRATYPQSLDPGAESQTQTKGYDDENDQRHFLFCSRRRF